MPGIAQKLFIERHGSLPWKPSTSYHPFDWPLLEKMLENGHLNYVDLALAQKILQVIGQKDEPSAALICHLSMAARQGHLCVTIDQQIVPDPEEVWTTKDNKNPKTILAEDWKALHSLIITGVEHAPANLITKDKIEFSPLFRWKNRFYLQRYWSLEDRFIMHVSAILEGHMPTLKPDITVVQSTVDRLLNEGKLLPEQAEAILKGCENAFTTIIGGPGTGKTYTAGILLRTLWECMPAKERASCQIRLAAPTGKAAANLEASIQRAFEGVLDKPTIVSQTLHSLLEVRKNARRGSVTRLDADIILVDESSMIDVSLMGSLMEGHKPGARLILLGDPYQLPPVEAGSLFANLVNFLKNSCRLVELTKCMRAELKEIVELADHVKNGDPLSFFTVLNSHPEAILHTCLDEASNSLHIQKRLIAETISRFPRVDTLVPVEALKAYSRFRILTPLRQGLLGTQQLNALFHAEMSSRASQSECYTIPIMITRNHHRLGLFNGESGLLFKHKQHRQKDFAIFAGRGNEETRKIPAIMLPEFEYAYCISIHKSQGSEFDHVLLFLPEGSESFGREALYTAITRARQKVDIWSSTSTLTKMINKRSVRHSSVVEKLREIVTDKVEVLS